MSLRTEQWICQGLAGSIECTVDYPEGDPVGWALVLHPHPLYGGTRDNKVVTTISRACVQQGLLCLRPNFRGVGASEGAFDQGKGETADMVQVVLQAMQRWPQLVALPWVLSGFSFGSAVAAQVQAELVDQAFVAPARVVLVGCAVERFRYRPLTMPAGTVIVHGEVDEVVPLSEAMDFARAHQLPVTVVPDASHFFHGKLLILRQVVDNNLMGLMAPQSVAGH